MANKTIINELKSYNNKERIYKQNNNNIIINNYICNHNYINYRLIPKSKNILNILPNEIVKREANLMTFVLIEVYLYLSIKGKMSI